MTTPVATFSNTFAAETFYKITEFIHLAKIDYFAIWQYLIENINQTNSANLCSISSS